MPSHMRWKEEYSVGVSHLDNQHRSLINMINELHDALVEKRAQQQLGLILERLVSYTQKHFDEEEAYMREIGFPDVEGHLKGHQAMKATVLELREEHRNGNLVIGIKTLQLLTGWLKQHIMKDDANYREHQRMVEREISWKKR